MHEVHRAPGGRELESLAEVAEFEPDRTFALRMLEGPLPIHAKISLEPSSLGTRMLSRPMANPRDRCGSRNRSCALAA